MPVPYTTRMVAKARGEALYFRFGSAALDMLTHGIEAALAAENDTLALELDDALQAVERLTDTVTEQPHSVYVLDTSVWLH